MADTLDSLYIDRSGLKVSRVMDQLIEQDILPAILSLKAFINRTVIPGPCCTGIGKT